MTETTGEPHRQGKQPWLFAPLDSVEDSTPKWTGLQLAALLNVDGLGPVGVMELVRACHSPSNYESAEVALSVSNRTAGFLPPVLPEPLARPENVEIVGFFDDLYPELLRRIPDPPPVLWVRGTLPLSHCLAVVGTRQPSAFGRGAARAAAETAAELGLSVVSGLALGVDTVAHSAALSRAGHTTAVLGSNPISPSPRSNRGLAEEILESGGALVSEVPPKVEARAYSLVRRNRIQSGMSVGTFIAETSIPGGTLHTARFAIEQGRALIVSWPGPEFADLTTVAGNLALSDPSGCSPEVLRAKGRLASKIALRRPVADFVVRSSGELPAILTELVGDVGRSTR